MHDALISAQKALEESSYQLQMLLLSPSADSGATVRQLPRLQMSAKAEVLWATQSHKGRVHLLVAVASACIICTSYMRRIPAQLQVIPWLRCLGC